jgi:transcription-repair coupling factor (superfamily II helicase)
MVAPFRTLGLPFVKAEYFGRFALEFGETIDIEALKSKLYAWGYAFSDIVVAQGEVSFRGDIIDIFPRGSQTPYRISLFDTEIEQISPFDPSTQKRAKEELERIEIPPAFLALSEEEYDALKARCEQSAYDVFVKDVASLGLWHLDEMGICRLKPTKPSWRAISIASSRSIFHCILRLRRVRIFCCRASRKPERGVILKRSMPSALSRRIRKKA